MKKAWFNYLVYLSLICLVLALYKADYLCILHIYSYASLALSLCFLFTGFICNAACWQAILVSHDVPAAFSESTASVGLSVFGKYIPGKIWLIVGRAAYISQKGHGNLPYLSSLSVNAQLLMSWLGLMFGAAGLFLLKGLQVWGWLIVILWLGLTAVLFSRFFHAIAEYLVKKIFKKQVTIPHIRLREMLSVLPWFLLYWCLYSTGFYFFVASLTEQSVPLSAALGYPLAGTLGLFAVILPGGLGAREGVMTGYLVLAGLGLENAASIAIAARLWFMTGESFIFLTGVIADKWFSGEKHA